MAMLPMKRFRKKPIVVEAVQATEGNMSFLLGVTRDRDKQAWVIETLEGTYEVKPGDWIITGIKGEHYPCAPEIFELTYESVDE